uniref:Granulocyte colony-stimulating factor n=1 Tax=Oncorhynchus kisutch TaxID=8019 RepID=A0A8C7GKV9_ONCKI
VEYILATLFSTVFAILCNMASYGQSAPILEYSGEAGQLVDDPEFNLSVENSKSLIKKVLDAIPETHTSCIHSETLILNSSSENRKLQYLAINLGIPSAPTLKALTDNFTLETCLRRMSEGLQVHQDLLRAVVQRLANTERITALLTDIRDLRVQINRVRLPSPVAVLPTATSLASRLTGDYEVQVATHLTLVQLQSFGQDIVRSLRNIAQANGQSD